MYQKSGKRILDFILAVTGLVLLLPLLFWIAVILTLHIRGNPFFLHPRPGLHGKVFKLIKFCTLNENGQPVSTFTKVLRIASFDELPQLWNVLKGEMSIVGPRPLLVEYLPLYNAKQQRRHEVLPGITGLAQVNGRNCLSWEEKFAYDIEYVENCSFRLDLKILLLTAGMLLDRKKSRQLVSVEPFKGNELC